MKTIIKEIRQKGFVPEDVRKHCFSNLTILEIRNWLEANGLDRHTPLELTSTEIAISTPEGLLLQIRACDNNALGMWGGCLENDETPLEGAIRELYKETGLKFDPAYWFWVDTYDHTHTYANQDKAMYTTHRYVILLDYVPTPTLNSESNGYKLFNSANEIEQVLEDQRGFVLGLISK